MNQQLLQLYEADIKDRNENVSPEELDVRDKQRILQVEKLISQDRDFVAQDYHHAALIFQHGDSVEHYQKAHKLAKKAVEMGDNSAKWLTAASLDRLLLMEGKAQKYGTQFKHNDNGLWELALPIDPTTTDEERITWNVPPLKDAFAVFHQKYGITGS